MGNIMHVNNALVEEVSITNRSRNTGYLIISYAVPMQNDMVSIELFRLNVNKSTVVLNSLGMPMCLCDVRQGMWIDAFISPAVTRSIPPPFLFSLYRSTSITKNTIEDIKMQEQTARCINR